MTSIRSPWSLLGGWWHRARPVLRPVGNAAAIATVDHTVDTSPGDTRIVARVRVTNEAGEREVMLYDVRVDASLLSDGPLDGVAVRTGVRSLDPHYPPRADRYWTAFVVPPHGAAELEVAVEVEGDGAGGREGDGTAGLYAACIVVHLDTYGGAGLQQRVHPIVLPLREREPAAELAWRDAGAGVRVAPIRTHLLTPVDDPVAVARRYAGPHGRAGDVLVLGESPLAVMQGRFRHPAEVRVGRLTGRLCYLLSGQGSLGTGPGLQVLIDQVGLPRVLWALLRGARGKSAGRDGDFYRTLGEQSRLIDDVTGTLPPYDRFIVLGPERAGEVAAGIATALGVDVAVVDANDLGHVDVIGASPGLDVELVEAALRSNPAGNAAESTPLVLIRRSSAEAE